MFYEEYEENAPYVPEVPWVRKQFSGYKYFVISTSRTGDRGWIVTNDIKDIEKMGHKNIISIDMESSDNDTMRAWMQANGNTRFWMDSAWSD